MSIPIIRWNPFSGMSIMYRWAGGPSRADFRRLEGVISREDVLEKYKEREAAILKRPY